MPISFRTKQDQVAEILRERIIAGVYPRGTKMKQAELAEALGVSITPIREALHALEAEGYVSGLSHKGLVVPPLNPDAARETFELRLLLERDLTATALPRVTSAILADLIASQSVIAGCTGRGDRLGTRTENYRFHFRLYELAERPQTLQFVRVLWAKYPFIGQELGGRRIRHLEEHDRFLERIAAGDHDGAVEAMVEHIKSGWRDLNAAPDAAAAGHSAQEPVAG